MGCKISKNLYSNYKIAKDEADYSRNVAMKLDKTFSSPQRGHDIFEKIPFEVMKLQKLSSDENWIPYNQFDHISYHSKDSVDESLNYFAIWKNGKTIEFKNWNVDWRVLLKEITHSSRMTQYELKLMIAELEFNHKIEIFGISQNPKTLNYVIVMDHFSGQLGN
ncbi:8970_t:CDS:2 [Funneliformis geosporum]|uniref:15_t:CDS:1 n=1 Tax=Funneliformis geosporum TaxID=1117311 RepID=A0A9W4SG34_9GLOM|nr:8970_t:CDS:2 [Funneliformis geosporum]CAI2167608.1 15_t:CDS:2 [Funneliformis geosporum]